MFRRAIAAFVLDDMFIQALKLWRLCLCYKHSERLSDDISLFRYNECFIIFLLTILLYRSKKGIDFLVVFILIKIKIIKIFSPTA